MNSRNGIAWEDPQKRRAILQQAIRTFAELGFRGSDVQVIADRAGVGKGTVYRYFRSKEDLFWATTYEVLQRLQAHMLAAMERADGPSRKIRAACVAYAGFFQADPHYLEIFVQDRAEFRGAAPEAHRQQHERMIEHFADIMQQGIAAGEFHPADVRQAIVSLGAMMYGTVVFGCYSKIDRTLTEMAEYAADVFLEGIKRGAPQSVKELQQ